MAENPPDDVAPRRVDDPRTLRALSHPLRLRILGELAVRSPQNVTMVAERLDEPANSVSYHLSQLVSHGLVQRAAAPAGATRRERWFEAVSRTGYAIQIDDDTPDQAATVAALRAWTLQVAADTFDRAVANEPEARRRGLPLGNAVVNVWLTPDEAHEVQAQLDAVLQPLARKLVAQRGLRPGADTEGLVHYTLDAGFFPDFSGQPPRGSVRTGVFDEGPVG